MFYDEIVKSIEKAISENNISEAINIVNTELSMPYIPEKFEEKLNSFKIDLMDKVNKYTSIDETTVLEYFESFDPFLNLKAISIMASYNLRTYLNEVQNYFLTNHNFDSKCLLADILIEQEIDYSFKVLVNNEIKEYNFKNLKRVVDQDIFILVKNKLSDIFENDNPSLFNFGLELLNKKLFLSYFEEVNISACNKMTEEILTQLIQLFDLNVAEYQRYFNN